MAIEVRVLDDAASLAREAADAVAAIVARQPEAVIGLPTGATPLGMYAELRRRVERAALDLRGATVIAIDELHGVPPEHPATNASYLRTHLDVPVRALHVMRSDAPDGDAECARFAALLRDAGGLDLVILGIGANGHLAFNEPGSPFDSRARRVALEPSTRESYARHFGPIEATPAFGLTLGLTDLLEARRALLLATGAEKAPAMRRALREPPSPDVPGSALQQHRDVLVLLDRAAAG